MPIILYTLKSTSIAQAINMIEQIAKTGRVYKPSEADKIEKAIEIVNDVDKRPKSFNNPKVLENMRNKKIASGEEINEDSMIGLEYINQAKRKLDEANKVLEEYPELNYKDIL